MSVLVLLSGGVDSATALAEAHNDGHVGLALSVNYGQTHQRELAASEAIAGSYGIMHDVLDLAGWGNMLPGGALTDKTIMVPDEEYAASNMTATVVPNRNGTFVMAAAGVAAAQGFNQIWLGVHGGDHDLYPDCRPQFIYSLAETVRLGTGGMVEMVAPFVDWSKTSIVQRGSVLDVPYQLTWSCYKDRNAHCGTCATCRERRQAFHDAGVEDWTVYENTDG